MTEKHFLLERASVNALLPEITFVEQTIFDKADEENGPSSR